MVLSIASGVSLSFMYLWWSVLFLGFHIGDSQDSGSFFIVILTAMGCSSKSTHTGLAKGRHTSGGVRRSPREGFPSSPSWGGGLHRARFFLQQWNVATRSIVSAQRSLLESQNPGFLWWCRHSACTTSHDYQNSKLLQGKPAGVHYKSRCLYSLGKLVLQDSVPPGRYLSLISYKSRRCSKSQSSDASPGPPPRAGHSKEQQQTCCTCPVQSLDHF